MIRAALILSLSLPCLALAQVPAPRDGVDPKLTLEAAVTEAENNSPLIQRYRAMVEESRWHQHAAFGEGYLPKISGTVDHYFKQKFEVLPVPGLGAFSEKYPTNLMELDATLPIFDGFASTKRWSAAGEQRLAAEKDLEFNSFTLQQSVRLAFYQALGAQLIHEVYEQNVKTLEEHLRQTRLLQSNGAGTAFDVLRVEVQLNEARSDAIEANDNVELNRTKLAQVMGRAQDGRPLTGDLPKPDLKVVQGVVYKPSEVQRGDLEAMDLRASALRKIASADAAFFVPKVSLIGNYQYYNINDGTWDNHQFNNAYAFGAALTWNIFDGAVSYSHAREAAAQHEQSEKASQQAKLELPYELEKWKRKFNSGWDRFNVRSLDVQKSEEEVRLARQEQKAGSRTSSEVLDAEVDMFKAEAGVVNAQLMAAEALINLELALGRRL